MRSLLLVLLLVLAGCSGSSDSAPAVTTPDPTPDITAPTDDDGVPADFTLYQDVSFTHTISSSLTSPQYSLSNAPGWLNIDSNTGVMTATANTYGMFSDVRVNVTGSGGTSEQKGPYTLKVVGDPFKQYQWHLTNTGQSAFAGHTGNANQDIHMANTIASGVNGTGIKIAISDTGIQESHPGLKNSLIAGASRNYLNNYSSTHTWIGNSSPDTSDDSNAHGTAVAGLAAERGWKGFGGRGVAPRASLAGFLFLPAQEQLATNGYLTAAFHDQFAGDFDIFNYSWGDLQCTLSEYDAADKYKMEYGTANLRGGLGAIYMKAAGNDFSGPLTDCVSGASSSAYFLGNSNFSEDNVTPYTIVIGAVNAKGTSSSYSSPGANLWVSAPGGEYGYSTYSDNTSVALDPALLTTDFIGCNLGLKNGSNNTFDKGQSPNANCQYTATMNGTSGATPVVSGAVALMLQVNPNLSWRDVKHILAATADKVASTSTNINHPATSGNLAGYVYEPGWTTNAAGYHFHNWYGFGRINVDNAVAMAKTYTSNLGTFKQTNTTTSSNITWKYDSGTLNNTVTGGVAAGTSPAALAVTENWIVEAVQIRVKATSCIGNLGIEVTSPSNTKSVVMNINSYIQDGVIDSHTFITNMFYGEPAQGNWKIKLIAAKAGCNTTLNNWQLNIIGH